MDTTGLWHVLDTSGELLFTVFADTADEAVSSVPEGHSAEVAPFDG